MRFLTMQPLLAFAVTGAFFAASDDMASAQERGSAYRAGLNIARKRHYSNPDCFASVFARHAMPHHDARRGHWVARAGTGYKGELWTRCGISR